MLAAISLFALAYNVHTAPQPLRVASASRPAAFSRSGSLCAQEVESKVATQAAASSISWIETPSGFKYIDEPIGSGVLPAAEDVVQVHYTVSLLSTGTTLGTTRGIEPLTFALGKHNVPVWDEALAGMRVGGKRRLLIPPTAIPPTQAEKVPGEERTLRFDFELVGVVDPADLKATVARSLPPSMARLGVGRLAFLALYALSFVPYVIPTQYQPQWYHDGLSREEIYARREAREQNRFIGGDMKQLDGLFPPP